MIARQEQLSPAPPSAAPPPESGVFARRLDSVERFRLATTDVDEARATISRLYGDGQIEPLPGEPFGHEVKVARLGAATCVEACWPGGARVEIPSLQRQYVFLAPTRDAAEVTVDHDARSLTAGRQAVLLSAGSCPRFHAPPGFRTRNLAIETSALEEHFLHLTGNAWRGHLRFEPVIDLQTESGASLLTLVRLLHCEMTRAQASPLLLVSLRDAVCTAFLTELPHSASHRLHPTPGGGAGMCAPCGGVHPRSCGRASDPRGHRHRRRHPRASPPARLPEGARHDPHGLPPSAAVRDRAGPPLGRRPRHDRGRRGLGAGLRRPRAASRSTTAPSGASGPPKARR